MEWHQHAQRTGEDAISGGHKGPVLVYIAKAPTTADAFDGQGTVWTKIYQSGLLDPTTQTWATDVVNADNGQCYVSSFFKTISLRWANAGKHSVIIPPSLPAGEYLLRSEIVRRLLYVPLTTISCNPLDCTTRRRKLSRCPILHWCLFIQISIRFVKTHYMNQDVVNSRSPAAVRLTRPRSLFQGLMWDLTLA